MTPPEDDLRAAKRATAEKIPPGPPPPPPRALPQRRRLIRPLSPGSWSRRSWAFALATVFLIGAVVAASLALGPVFTGHRSPVSPRQSHREGPGHDRGAPALPRLHRGHRGRR